MVSNTSRPHFTSGKDPVPILQEAGWAPGSIWTGGKSRLHRDSIPDRPALSQSLYRLSYPAHIVIVYFSLNTKSECVCVCVCVCEREREERERGERERGQTWVRIYALRRNGTDKASVKILHTRYFKL